MKLADKLVGDDIRRKAGVMLLAKNIASSEKIFSELMECFFSADYRLSQRAAWVVSHTVPLNQNLISPYLVNMVEQLAKPDVPVAVARNTLRILRIIAIPEDVQGSLMNTCFVLVEKKDTPVAIKAFSLLLLKKLSETYPDISDELKMIAQNNMMNKKAAIRNVARKILQNQTKAKPHV